MNSSQKTEKLNEWTENEKAQFMVLHKRHPQNNDNDNKRSARSNKEEENMTHVFDFIYAS